ncbi:UBN2_3 domain-containing protein [Cephalotus follicularis]|uniref:UBN2_3 domain-containing protein n=1 Tax=Cephalotus follicularis TaxID=3775 RepID=A0A1Q3BSX4_CEPFO|nr:UBN2_3 domain-containing protein [Cephalotus follicularis]
MFMLLNRRNFLPWSQAVTIALGGCSKLSYINGQAKVPDEADPKFAECEANDHLVIMWIFNSMESQIYEIFAYSNTAQSLWESLKKMHGQQDNASRIFELQQEIFCSKKSSNQSFTNILGT